MGGVKVVVGRSRSECCIGVTVRRLSVPVERLRVLGLLVHPCVMYVALYVFIGRVVGMSVVDCERILR